MLLAMAVPLGLLAVQVAAVQTFVRASQQAVVFIAAAHTAIEADFRARDLADQLRQSVKGLPSTAVVRSTSEEADRRMRAELIEGASGAVDEILGSGAVNELDDAVLDRLRSSMREAAIATDAAESLAAGATDLNALFEGAIRADRALAALEAALDAAALGLRRELQEAVDKEREIHDRPLIAGITIGVTAMLFLVVFTILYADRHLARRIKALGNAMTAIACGDLQAPIPVDGGGDEIGDMARALLVFRDTAVEIEEQDLRERQVVLDTIDYGVLILRSDLAVRMYNRAFRNLWHLSGDALPPRLPMRAILEHPAVRELHGGEDAAWELYVEERLATIAAADGAPQEWRRTDGRVVQCEVVPLPDGGRMLTYFDLTELKKVEAELRAARDDAELASRAKSDFLASMSHELRTPLNAIIGITEMLKEDAADEGATHLDEPLARVLRAGRLLLQLINEVLDLAKIEAGKLELQEELFDLKALLEGVLETAEPLADRRSNTLRFEHNGDLGSVRTDPMRLRQVMLNLLSNACKFTDNGAVTLRAAREGDTVILAVTDTGIGIEPDQLPQLFQEFHQAGAAKHRKYGGTGLGLAISRRLVHLMGGEIVATSALGAGSTFTVEIPLRTERAVEAA